LDLERRELTRNGVSVQLKGRALDVLCVLAAAKGETVTKDTLMSRVWPNVGGDGEQPCRSTSRRCARRSMEKETAKASW